ncbi:MAG: hypothetical protein ACYTGQ_20050 [Planctomycetota bacterium]
MIKRFIEYELTGQTGFNFHRDGLECVIVTPEATPTGKRTLRTQAS